MYKYAQTDEDGKLIGISFLSGEVDAPNMILLGDATEHINIGWQFIDGDWLEPLQQEEPAAPQPEPSNAEIAKLMTEIYASLYIAGVI